MTTETLLLVGHDAGDARDVFETHAERLGQRASVDAVEVATYGSEPVRELQEQFGSIDADRVYVVPMCVAHTRETVDRVPAALSYVAGEVHYCEPPGRSVAITELVAEKGDELVPAASDAALVLVGFGSSSKPYHRQTAEYLRDGSEYGEVLSCYLLQNPAVECVRYNVSAPRAVAVPLFVARTPATEQRIPDELELARGGIEYAGPFGTHPRMTDAVHATFEAERALVSGEGSPPSVGSDLTAPRRPVATDGEGTPSP